MKILSLTAGAASMYCGSCLQGNTLAAALRRAGEEATLVPLYTPLRTDEDDVSAARIAFGAWLHSAHENMPQLIVDQDQADDVWAYLSSLEGGGE